MSGTWARSPSWGVVDRADELAHGGRIYAASLTAGRIHTVDGPAAAVARAAMTGSGLELIRLRVAADLGVEAGEIVDEVLVDLLGELVDLGLLTRQP